jgi:hypothetical protein
MKLKTRMWIELSVLGVSTAALIAALLIPVKSHAVRMDNPIAPTSHVGTTTTVDTFWVSAIVVGLIFAAAAWIWRGIVRRHRAKE